MSSMQSRTQTHSMVPTLGGAQLWADRRYREGWRVQEHVITGHHRLLDPNDRRHAFGTLERCTDKLDRLQPHTHPADVVVLLHGLGRSRRSLAGIAAALEAAGHRTVRLDYPSTRRSLGAHVAQVLEVLAHLEGVGRVSFVTHSLGGIVARGVLASPRWPDGVEKGRVVMMAPPNQGSALARTFVNAVPTVFGGVVGPAGFEVARGVAFAEPCSPVMVIAGRPREGAGLNPLLDGEDDGVVCVEETKLSTMSEHVVVDALHTVIMDHPEAQNAALRFLRIPSEFGTGGL
ncbi:MAG: alpha/beta hydrolase [bacterium]